MSPSMSLLKTPILYHILGLFVNGKIEKSIICKSIQLKSMANYKIYLEKSPKPVFWYISFTEIRICQQENINKLSTLTKGVINEMDAAFSTAPIKD